MNASTSTSVRLRSSSNARFRVSSVVTLMRNCLEMGSDGHPYLRYFNVKASREAMLPIPPLLAEQLGRQQAFLKERIARAKQALPNGYCGLPLVQSCPHPNACLSCESFLTDGSFRAVHEQQQAETRRLLEKARRQGSLRLVEVLKRDEQSLSRILEGLDQIEADHADGDELDLRALAAPDETEGA